MSHDHLHHQGHNHGCCSHESEGSCCHSDSSCDAHHHHDDSCCSHDHEDFYSELFEMADEAWMEVLKSKIKDQIEATSGPHLDELAKIVSDANHERWKNKMGKRRGVHNFRDQVRNFFNQGT